MIVTEHLKEDRLRQKIASGKLIGRVLSIELLFWRGSERVEDYFIMIYTDVFNQTLPLAETLGEGGGGSSIIWGRSLPPASPSR